jgi:hypothetical protein
MSSGLVACPNCRTILPGAACNSDRPLPCPGCERMIHIDVFPALFRARPAALKAESILEAGVSSCFYHEAKIAVVPCDGCGRFLCALCDVEFGGRHICPACFDNSRVKGDVMNLETGRIVYDSAALSLTLVPLLIWPITLVTAPAAFACAIFSFFRPTSIVHRSRIRAYLAVLFSLSQMLGWTWVLFLIPD